ncbi:MAG: large subunit ribosomal protein L35 [Planctomycetota bacterium]|jgi:large subunit ribosomal protein L35
MPKMKSKGAVKKRFRVSKSGKVSANRAARGHMHAKNDSKTRRKLNSRLILTPTVGRIMRRLMGDR